MQTRRTALITLAAAASSPALLGQQTAPAARTFQTLSPDEGITISKLVDLIIPRTETAGASDAGVPFYIDHALANAPRTLEICRKGLTAAHGLDDAALLAFLTAEHNADTPFFHALKNLTVEGYYTSREGLVTELGWHGNTYLHEFVGCTHPEHQVEPDREPHAD